MTEDLIQQPWARRSPAPAQKLQQGSMGKIQTGKWRDTELLQCRWHWIFENNSLLQTHGKLLGQFTERSACLELLTTTIYAAALKTKPELVICNFCSCFAIKVCDQECNGLVHKAEPILFLHLSYFEYLSLYYLTALFCGHSCRNYLPPGGQTLPGSSENPLCLFIWWIYFGATWLVALWILS